MNEQMLEQQSGEVLMVEVSDEALEKAANGLGVPAPQLCSPGNGTTYDIRRCNSIPFCR